ncbi:hypothetical protein PM082_009995 [Marasmius tenuissimus]|nr:hypothetical protein PM082_009995 [Marasmius tenuissimus]
MKILTDVRGKAYEYIHASFRSSRILERRKWTCEGCRNRSGRIETVAGVGRSEDEKEGFDKWKLCMAVSGAGATTPVVTDDGTTAPTREKTTVRFSGGEVDVSKPYFG